MATKETAVATAPAPGAIAPISNDRLAALAQQAKDAASKERPAVTKVSLKAGVVTVGGNAVKDNELECIIVVATYRNAFYPGRYDPNNIVNPTCFAFGESDEDMAPADVVDNPVHASCEGCPNAEWGSDLNGGRGKACKETRRLILIPASALSDADPVKAIKEAELAILDVPVTSVKNYSQYVNILSASIGLPMWACVTKVSTKPDAKTQFKVLFQGLRPVPGDAVLDAIESRKAEALRIGLMGYESSHDADAEPPAPPAAAAKASKKF